MGLRLVCGDKNWKRVRNRLDADAADRAPIDDERKHDLVRSAQRAVALVAAAAAATDAVMIAARDVAAVESELGIHTAQQCVKPAERAEVAMRESHNRGDALVGARCRQ